MEAILDEAIELTTHQLAIAELRYLLCRNIGKERSTERPEKLLSSGHLRVKDPSELIQKIADYKGYQSLLHG